MKYKYEYFVSYVTNKNEKLAFGCVIIAMNNKLKNNQHLLEVKKIIEKEYGFEDNMVILNYELLGKVREQKYDRRRKES